MYRLDRVTDDLETVERLVAAGKIPASDDDRRRMRALLERLIRDADELFDIGAAVAHVQAKIEKGTN